MYWVIATLSIAMIPQLVSMPPHLVPLVLLPLVWRTLAEARGWKPMPAVLRIALTVLFVLVMVISYGGLMGRRAAVGLLTVMLSLKLLEAFRVRDARVVASLSLFLCATQFLFSQGLAMVAYSGITMICALVALAYLHRRESFSPIGEAPPSGLSLFSELGFSARLLALAVPVALAFFLLFPRWGSPLWGMPEAALDARTGLSNSMSPGSIQNLFMDDTPAFRAEFHGDSPPHQALYWRGPVFWNFDGKEWTSLYFGRNLRAATRPDPGTSPWHYTVQIEPTEQHWIFALDYPAIVPRGTRLTMDYQLYSRRSITRLSTYEMRSDPSFVDSPELRTTFRRAALELPDGFNPRTMEMMRQWRRETPGGPELANRVLRYFNEQEFHYTLNPPLLSRHTVDEFLFDTRSGFCEHYASAFTVMMRMAGIPARVVTGYQGGWYNDFGNYVLVRQADAHAWSEIWLPGTGWTRVDPTGAVAPNRVESGALDALSGRRHMFDFGWLRSARNGFDFLQRHWNDWVITFSANSQASMFRPFGLGQMNSTRLVAIMVVVIVLVSLVMLPAIIRLRQAVENDPAVKLWIKFRKKLARAGIETLSSQAPMELAEAAGSQVHESKGEIDRIAELYYRLRYAPGAHGLDEFARAVRSFRVAGQSH
jgi:transglutaminase-like putative cysteine protease